jgi:hypothetical protein
VTLADGAAALSQPAQEGSPLYSVLPEHLPGLLAVALVPLLAVILRWSGARGGARTSALVSGYRTLPSDERFLVWLVASTAAVHLGLIAGEWPRPIALAFLADALALLFVLRRLLLGGRWHRLARLVLFASIAAYAVSLVAGEPPDQAGLLTKLIELAALGIALGPQRDGALRRLASSAATVSSVLVVGVAAWLGAFVAAEGEGGHHGNVAPPGTILAAAEDRAATAAERRSVSRFYEAAVAALARYADPAAARADGYDVKGLAGTDFHAANHAYGSDGRIFDPARPESLVYADTPRGAVLLGAVYEMPGVGQAGPAIGGPLTVWHGHEQVCLSLAPPAFSGLVSPFGGCPALSFAFPATPEMIHLWVAPGAPTMFGDLDEEWRQEYVESFATG